MARLLWCWPHQTNLLFIGYVRVSLVLRLACPYIVSNLLLIGYVRVSLVLHLARPYTVSINWLIGKMHGRSKCSTRLTPTVANQEKKSLTWLAYHEPCHLPFTPALCKPPQTPVCGTKHAQYFDGWFLAKPIFVKTTATQPILLPGMHTVNDHKLS
jgi:hypothetical protein